MARQVGSVLMEDQAEVISKDSIRFSFTLGRRKGPLLGFVIPPLKDAYSIEELSN
jgi:hypothetical protein